MKITAPDGAETHFTYDAMGNRTKVADPLGQETQYAYDAASRLVGVTDALNRTTEFTLDAAGNRLATKDPLGRTSSAQFDAQSRATAVTAPDGGSTSLEYDPAGNLVALTDPLLHTTLWQYDALNRPVTKTDALGNSTATSYDAAGRVDTWTNAKGRVMRYTYDASGRPTSLDVAGTDTVSWSYDGAGNLVEVGDVDSNVRLTLDANGRVTGSQQANGTVGYAYDIAGRRTRTTSGSRAIDYSYDAVNRLTGLIDPSGRPYSFTYDLAGHLTQQTLPNHTATSFTYDAAGQLTDQLHTSTAAGTVAQNTYVHDAAGQIEGWGTPDGNTRTFTYDSNSRLTAANSSLPTVPSETFAYDLMGNWTPFDGRVHDEANQLVEDNGFTYRYDADGNLVEKRSKSNSAEVTTYAWDPLNRLVGVRTSTHAVTYRYDGLGHRIARTVDGVETRFVLDEDNVLEERDAAGALKAFNVHAGLDVLLAREDAANGATYWAHADHLGSIQALTDATGSVIERYRYSAFGQPTVLGPDGSPVQVAARQPFAFTGREWEPETGLSFHRTRFLDPTLGRWLSRDPMGEAGGISLYGYVNNNPTNAIDPLGLDTYIVNRWLSAIGSWVGVESSASRLSIATHTFVVTTNPDGSVNHTYSWGNDANLRGWNLDQPLDLLTAQQALSRGQAQHVGADSLDPFIAAAFAQLNKPENEHANLFVARNCKVEAHKLVSTAKQKELEAAISNFFRGLFDFSFEGIPGRGGPRFGPQFEDGGDR